MSGGWGSGSWGTGSYGGVLPLGLADAHARTTRTVRVTLTAPALARSVLGIGDALNPATWQIYKGAPATPWTVFSVALVDLGTKFDITVWQDLADRFTTLTLRSTTLVSPAYAPIIAPTTFAFPGLAAAPEAIEFVAPYDLAARGVSPELAGDVLVPDAHGGYAQQRGVELLRKLILRRLTTAPGAYAHLPNYGAGLTTGRLIRPTDLPGLRAEIARQVELEPEVREVGVTLTLGHNTLRISLTVTSGGATLPMTFEVPV